MPMADDSIVSDAYRYITGGYSDWEDSDSSYSGRAESDSDSEDIEFKPGLPMLDLTFDHKGGGLSSLNLYDDKYAELDNSVDVISAFLSPTTTSSNYLETPKSNLESSSSIVSISCVFPDLPQFKKELNKYLDALDKLDMIF